MGCDDTREDIEEKIVYARLERDQIRKKRKLLLDELRICTGEEIHPEPIPDYIDINYIKEKRRKMIEKKVKKAVKEEVERKKEEEKKQKEFEEEMKRLEREGYDEEFLYQPLNMKIKNKHSPLDDIYYLNYVLEKKDKNENKNIEEEEEMLNESKDNGGKNKSILKKNKKVKFKEDLKEEDKDENSEKSNENENEEEIDNDIIEKVDAKIATKTGSIASVLGKEKKTKNRISRNSSIGDEDSKSIPYYTPHLQPDD